MPQERSSRRSEFPYRHPIEVRFVDTDALGHINNATYLTYFEAARAGYYAAVTGTPFNTGADAQRHTFLIAEAHIRYVTPAFFGEALACDCRVAWMSRSAFGLEYRVHTEPAAEPRVVAEGSTVQVMYDLVAQRVARVPPELAGRIEAFEGRSLPGRPARSMRGEPSV